MNKVILFLSIVLLISCNTLDVKSEKISKEEKVVTKDDPGQIPKVTGVGGILFHAENSKKKNGIRKF